MCEEVTLTIDGETVEVAADKSVLEAALLADVCIPNLCFLPDAHANGACRVCLVEVERHGRRKMTASCTLEVREGMIIHTDTDDVKRARRNIVELLLAEAPESEVLQHLAERLEVGEVRYPERDKECMLCGRCVAACADVAKEGTLGFIGRGTQRHVGLPFYNEEYCVHCDECKARCPVELSPSGRRGQNFGVCGTELSMNEEIPDICESCVLD
jgi:NADH dehydrogenase/NADH:ubiquinone oxidoreductase subunit G